MKLPEVIIDLVKAQDNYDSVAYANCFSDMGVMFDEGKAHTGRTEIQHWIAEGNEKYKSVMKPLSFTETDSASVLSAEISGTFEGSPIILTYHFVIIGEKIDYLKITG